MSAIDEQDLAYFEYDEDAPEFGCAHCGFEGWLHGCCDDLCYGANEAQDCDNARACRHCNPYGDIR